MSGSLPPYMVFIWHSTRRSASFILSLGKNIICTHCPAAVLMSASRTERILPQGAHHSRSKAGEHQRTTYADGRFCYLEKPMRMNRGKSGKKMNKQEECHVEGQR
jgi:hypothetical protein